jgi:hypothetical protein
MGALFLPHPVAAPFPQAGGAFDGILSLTMDSNPFLHNHAQARDITFFSSKIDTVIALLLARDRK